MNFLLLTLALSVISSVSFYFFGHSGAMSAYASILLSFEGIIGAAVLVRLNRGVPSVDWKSVDVDATKRLLNRLEDVARVYILIVAATLLSVVTLLVILYIDKTSLTNKGSYISILSAVFGGIFGLIVSRMTFVVWLDYDIVRLQKAVILSAAEAEERQKQGKVADDKLQSMNNARITQL